MKIQIAIVIAALIVALFLLAEQVIYIVYFILMYRKESNHEAQ